MKKIIFLSVVVLITIFISLPSLLDWKLNGVKRKRDWPVSNLASSLHNELEIMDWHSDFFLWQRDFLKRSSRGHTDLIRLQEGNVAIQMFTIVSKSILGQNPNHTDENGIDSIGLLSAFQLRDFSMWTSPKARAEFQVEKIVNISKSSEDIILVKSKEDLLAGLEKREKNKKILLMMIGLEGLHALEGDINNIDKFKNLGVTMFGLHHFFDNKLGGSLHGRSKSGLTQFGKEVIVKINESGLILDLSHSSEDVVRDVLKISTRPIVLSHTGFKGHCNSHRNISDELMQEIAHKGGLISVGFWKTAICKRSPKAIVQAIRYGINLVGVDHIALGSDFDGAVKTSFDASELSVLTHEMIKQGFSQVEIRKVMGENSIRFLKENLN